jgi:hypothetical protein
MNLHSMVSGSISAINAPTMLSIKTSTGYTTQPDGKRTPTYNDPVVVKADVQALDAGEIQHLDALNIQGRRMAFYINGNIDGLIRPNNQGGDIIDIVSGGNNLALVGTQWLVASILEYWPDWCKVAAVLQNPPIVPVVRFVVPPVPVPPPPPTFLDIRSGGILLEFASPPLPIPFATADFINGVYTINSNSQTLAQVIDTPARVSASGLKVISGTPVQILGLFLAALITLNWTVVIKFNFLPGSFGRSFLTTVFDVFLAGQVALYVSGDLVGFEDSNTGLTRVAFTFPNVLIAENKGAWTCVDAQLSDSLNGSLPNIADGSIDTTSITPAQWLNPPVQVQAADAAFTTGEFYGYVEKIDIYTPQNSAVMAQLTAGFGPLVPGWLNRTANTIGGQGGIGIASSESGARLFMCGFGVGSAGSSISYDNGVTWVDTDTGYTDIVKVAAASSYEGKVLVAINQTAGGFQRSIRRSIDYGQTWTTTNIVGIGHIGSIALSRLGNVVVVGDTQSTFHVWVSTDSGATFTERPAFGNSQWFYVAVDQNGANIYANASNGAVKRSTNQGATATDITPPLAVNGVAGICCSTNGDTLVCAGVTGSPPRVWQTSNFGANWFDFGPVPDGLNGGAQQIVFGGAILYLSFGGFSPWLSSDGGQTWTAQTQVPADTWVQGSVSRFGELAAVCNGNVWTAQFF